jgi:hypothetical protein
VKVLFSIRHRVHPAPVQRLPGTFTLKIKLPRLEDDLLSPFSVEVKNAWSHTSTLHGLVLRYADNFTFT